MKIKRWIIRNPDNFASLDSPKRNGTEKSIIKMLFVQCIVSSDSASVAASYEYFYY
ncbi:hypothetical protein CAter282_4006 [Collimonas arenae]|uniref:Uncharacterized protein n=1 Tax=Collimonas arenae TaxID=279058 RepID=A0A127QNR7_9BURK|nr:hypothetical protein CAter282_4006 [Collimonas arenae]